MLNLMPTTGPGMVMASCWAWIQTQWATVKLHDGAGKANGSLEFEKIFVWVSSGCLLLKSMQGWSWRASRGQPQELRHEDIYISFRKSQAFSSVSGLFGFFLSCTIILPWDAWGSILFFYASDTQASSGFLLYRYRLLA